MTDLGNDRIFYANVGFFYSAAGGGATTYLNGVQSVDYTRDLTPETIFDPGHMQQVYMRYGKTGYTITVNRVLPIGGNTFFQSAGTTYLTGHLLDASNINVGGPNNTVRQYDLRIVYGRDDKSWLAEAGNDYSSILFQYAILTGMSYTFTVDGSIQESLTFFSNQYEQGTTNGSSPATPEGVSPPVNVLRRQHLDTTNCIFPKEVEEAFEITNSELNDIPILGIQQIELNCEIGYRDLPDGKWQGSDVPSQANLYRIVELPVAVTASFTGIIRSHYFQKSAPQDHLITDTYHTSLPYGSETKALDNYRPDRRIKIQSLEVATNEYWTWDLAARNYLTSFDVSGGDTGGGNIEATLSFQNDASDFFLYQGTTSPDYTSSSIL